MKILLIFSLFLSLSLSLPTTTNVLEMVYSFVNELHRQSLESRINRQHQIITQSSNELRQRASNEPDFPFRLSQEFLNQNQREIRSLVNEFGVLMFQMSEFFGPGSETTSLALASRRDNEEERVSLFHYGLHPVIFEDGGMLVSLINGQLNPMTDAQLQAAIEQERKYEEEEIQLALEKLLAIECDKNIKEEEFCLTCYGHNKINHRLKCCGKVHHKECLANWWRTLKHKQPLSCPHCRKTAISTSLDEE